MANLCPRATIKRIKQHLLSGIHNETNQWDKFLLDRTGWIDVCTQALHITNTDIGLGLLLLRIILIIKANKMLTVC